ncbi:TPA: hypothetical protein HA291_01710 [Candidatus Micrarchaeota archaeon]|jgi:hypothetical protein|nr:hypothetical protein [Candidatus Micrarchaeota archaeon]HII10189.1 hypothetical protein [Candidatus Micrarchaeota archaeon]
MNKINLVLLLLLGTFLVGVNHASAATVNASCSYNIAGSNHSYYPGSGCGRISYNFTAGSSNNKVYCQNGPGVQLYGVNFLNYSYNNTLINCTFANARIYSLHGAKNNLISPYGKYNVSFADNSSDMAVGYYLSFITRNISGARSYSAFVTVVPYGLYKADPNEIGSQGLTLAQIGEIARSGNYILPRFGYYASLDSTSGTYTLPLESVDIYRNRSVSYSPYWLMSPYWGLDSVVFKTFDMNSNMNYSPNLIWPKTREYVTLPDNATVYWNFSLIHYNNATNLTAYIFSGWQVDPDNKIVDVVHNITGNTVSYNAGVQKPGIYEYIVALKSLEAREHVNTTTETYSVGLSYCVTAGGVDLPGYYTLTYNNLTAFGLFARSNQTCSVPLPINASDVTVNCRGGSINSTGTSISIATSNNVSIENCKIYGNALYVHKSSNIYIRNTSIMANNDTNIIINASNSSGIYFENDRISGYSNQSIGQVNLTNTTLFGVKYGVQQAAPGGDSVGANNGVAAYAAIFIESFAILLFVLALAYLMIGALRGR